MTYLVKCACFSICALFAHCLLHLSFARLTQSSVEGCSQTVLGSRAPLGLGGPAPIAKALRVVVEIVDQLLNPPMRENSMK